MGQPRIPGKLRIVGEYPETRGDLRDKGDSLPTLE
jgi:hypothetical protein